MDNKNRWHGMLTAAGVVAAAGTVLGFLGAWSWFFDLFAHFRVQYLWGLMLIGTGCLMSRKRIWATLFIGMAMVNLAYILPFYFGKPAPHGYTTAPMRAMLINVNTVTGDPQKVIEAIRAHNPDFVVLQEISARWCRILEPALAADYPHSARQPGEDNFGIGVWSKHAPATSPHNTIATAGTFDLPYIVRVFETPQSTFMLLASHPFPPIGATGTEARNSQLAAHAGFIRATANENIPTVLIGDLNATPWSAAFKKLLRDTGIKNASQGRGLYPTWPTFFLPLRIPIDQFLHTPEIEIISRQTGPHVGSDHFPVIVDFKLPPPH